MNQPEAKTPLTGSLEDEANKAMVCLYICVDSQIADDVKHRVGAFVCQLKRERDEALAQLAEANKEINGYKETLEIQREHIAETTKDKESLINRLEITNAAWVNDIGCYPLPYGNKRHIRDILQLNENTIAAIKPQQSNQGE